MVKFNLINSKGSIEEAIKNQTYFICNYCQKQFKIKSRLASHIKIHLKETNTRYFCSECKDNTRTCIHRDYLKNYYSELSRSLKIFTCTQCAYTCHNKAKLLTHVNRDHLKILSTICEICAKQFNSNAEYKTHVINFHTELLYKCTYCDRHYKDESNLIKHEVKCQFVGTFKCTNCPAAFPTKVTLQNHINKHVKKFECTLCNKVLSNNNTLDIHIKSHLIDKKTSKKTYLCGICHVNFNTMTERKEHMKLQHSSTEKPFCYICNKVFETHRKFVSHLSKPTHKCMQENAKTEYSVKCNECDYTSSGRLAMEAHINKVHLKVTPYECTICNSKFSGKSLLKSHMKVHNKAKDHICELCSKPFGSVTALKKHQLRHLIEKPYKCHLCSETFVADSLKILHVQRKHGEKNILCPICQKMFTTNINMKNHVRKVHWKRVEPFDYKKIPGLAPEFYDNFIDKRK